MNSSPLIIYLSPTKCIGIGLSGWQTNLLGVTDKGRIYSQKLISELIKALKQSSQRKLSYQGEQTRLSNGRKLRSQQVPNFCDR